MISLKHHFGLLEEEAVTQIEDCVYHPDHSDVTISIRNLIQNKLIHSCIYLTDDDVKSAL